MGVGIVTDSTSMLPASVAAEHGIVVVPMSIAIGDEQFSEFEIDSAALIAALGGKPAVSTSRPAPAALATAYAELAASGCTEIVSLHLSGTMSGTVESAQLAARDADVPVTVVDSRGVGACVGYAALAAAKAVAAGATAAQVATAAMDQADGAKTFIYVDTLEHLRRGGRVGPVGALVGSALAVKPLLEILDGRVVARERVRTRSRALTRLRETAVDLAQGRQVQICVSHLANREIADDIAAGLAEELAVELDGRAVDRWDLGAVLGAHVGPGTIAVCVAPRP
ncbi:MAG: DegV family protein [Nocardioides sp.]